MRPIRCVVTPLFPAGGVAAPLPGLVLAAVLMTAGTAAGQSTPARAVATTSSAHAPEHPLRPAIQIAQASLHALQNVRDYECRFLKRERINGELQTQVMFLRLREEPFSVYLRFGEPHPGREVLYVAGRNNGQMLAHEGSGVKAIFGTVSLPLDAPEVRAENRHPLTEIGLRKLLELLIEQWEAETQFGEIDVQYYPDARLGEIACRVVEASHPYPRRQFRSHMTRLYLDARTNLPVRVENYGWPERSGAEPVLIEEYTYLELRPNVPLDDRHFDRHCPEYNF
jgi:hypothetical protein